ncbi:MAG: 50S ribosomal protein L31e [Candidatus Bathyarchaeia archaeon]
MEENTREEPLKTEEKQEKPVEAAEEKEIEEALTEEEEKTEEIVEAKEEEKPEVIEEEVKPPPREEKAEEEIVEERTYTIPLSKAWIMPPNKRAPRAMRIIRSFVMKHMKLDTRKEGEEEEEPKRLIISNEVNEKVWGRGIEKPPRKIRVRAAKDKEGNVTVYLAEGD